MKKPQGSHCQPGFALVATISVMVLLVMIALAMLSLSTVELRGSRQADHQYEARANARMALMIAIGELQKYAGNDQRVTAEASILENPQDNTHKLANRHWVGVWRTDAFKHEPSLPSAEQAIIHRNNDTTGSEAGSLIDRRADGSYNAQSQALTWLVSHNKASGESPDPSIDLVQADSILLVGENSTSELSDYVRAQKIAVTEDGKQTGAYSWWVGDEGVKARFNLTEATTGLGHEQPWLTATQYGIDTIEGYSDYESLSESDISKVISRHSSELSGSSGSRGEAQTARLKNFHDVTYTSNGLLTDTLRGGLRRDLSSFLANGSAPDLANRKGIQKNDPILNSNKLKNVSAKFGLLHHWNSLAQQNSGGIAPIPPKSLANGTAWGWTNISEQDKHGSAVNLATQDTAPIHPVMIEAGISYGLSLTKAGSSKDGKTPYRLNIHYYPRVVLWNPYNVKINAAKYVTQISMPHRFDVRVIVPGANDIIIDPKYTFLTGRHDRYKNLPHRPHFSIPSTSFEPGEALLFTADGDGNRHGSKTWGDNPYSSPNDINYYSLSCTKTPPLTDGFHISMHEPVLQIPNEKISRLAYKIHARKDNVYKLFFYKLYLNNGTGGDFGEISKSPDKYPPLQHISQTENGSSGSEGPWYSDDTADTASSQLREMKDGPITPFYRFKWGHRIQWIEETYENSTVNPGIYNTPYLGYNTIANHNLRAGWHVRSPIEVAYRATQAGGRYTHGIAIDDPYGWDWEDSAYAPVPVKGKNRVSPFGSPAQFGGQNFPMLDIPSKEAPFITLGALQHAPLSQFVWHPTNAMANSLADPRVARNRSSNYVSPSDWEQIGQKNQKWEAIRQAHANPDLNEASFLYDLSYETNHALWDRYFLSTIKDNLTPDLPLDNPRLTVSADKSSATTEELQNFHKAAKHLQIKGAFNINSTSVKAWAALFASFRSNPEMKITLQDGNTLHANDIYSRFLKPYDQEYSNQGPYDSETWKGHRKLTNAQIHELAEEVVKEVKQRGPFISLSDFVNRRLVDPPNTSNNETHFSKTGLKGPLQAAIDRTEINREHLTSHPIEKEEYEMGGSGQGKYGSSYPELTFPVQNNLPEFGPKPDHNHWAASKLSGAPSYLTQADMLQKFGSVISARSDTFVIRTYGESIGAGGKIQAKAWCEAIVQRTTQPIMPDDHNIDPETDINTTPAAAFGRKFKIISFRWLNGKEI